MNNEKKRSEKCWEPFRNLFKKRPAAHAYDASTCSFFVCLPIRICAEHCNVKVDSQNKNKVVGNVVVRAIHLKNRNKSLGKASH
jgi:hypothetical protein